MEQDLKQSVATQDVIELHFPDYSAHTFALNRSGTNAVLAVQKLLAVVDLQGSSHKAVRKLNTHGSGRSDVKTVEWGPHASNANLIASAFQNQVDIWDLEMERTGSPKCILKAHTKPTYGLNWSLFDPNLCATCAADSFVYIWDLREFRKPQEKFKVVVGASAVQWNRLNSQLLASVHDSDVRIWDTRKSSSAVGYISAHFGKVNCIDWSHQEEKKFITCSQDNSIKVWDKQQPRTALNVLKPWPHPPGRVLFTPFGDGIVSSSAPTVHGATDPNILLWANSLEADPIHVFSAGQEATNEMKWLSRPDGSNTKFYLTTWSKVERKLRIWTVPSEVEEMCKSDRTIETEVQKAMSRNLSTSGMPTTNTTLPGIGSGTAAVDQPDVPLGRITSPGSSTMLSLPYSSSIHTLEKEFSLVDVDIPNIKIEKRDHIKRSCRVKCSSGMKLVTLDISFPQFYPSNAPPFFVIDSIVTNIDHQSQLSLMQSLNEVASSSVKESKPCLQLCLRRLSGIIDDLQCKPDTPKVSGTFPSPVNQYKRKESYATTFADEYIPFPRTNGARFCGNGLLVVFRRPAKLALVSVDNQKTPKSMAEITTLRSVKLASRGPANRQPPPMRTSSSPGVPAISVSFGPIIKTQQHTSIMPYIVKEKPMRSSTGGSSNGQIESLSSNPYVCVIEINNADSILPFSLNLAESYELSAQTVEEFCKQNTKLASASGRSDLVQTWSLVRLVTSVNTIPPPLSSENGLPWSAHPMGRQLVESLLEHYWSLYDVQTVAMLSCALQMYDILVQNVILKEKGVDASSYSAHSRPTQLLMTNTRSVSILSPTVNSPPMESRQMWGILGGKRSYHLNDFSFDDSEDHVVDEDDQHFENCLLLSRVMSQRCIEARRCYSNILARWQLVTQMTEVLKYQPSKEQDHVGVEFSNTCQYCSCSSRGPKCHCQRMAFNCIICHTAVRGLSNFCLSCGHGGHAVHLQQWFASSSECPAGCGCRCLDDSLKML